MGEDDLGCYLLPAPPPLRPALRSSALSSRGYTQPGLRDRGGGGGGDGGEGANKRDEELRALRSGRTVGFLSRYRLGVDALPSP